MNSHEINPGTFELLSVEWGNRGPNSEKAIILSIKSENGEILSVANNWARGQQDRFNHAKKLIGKKIIYSTWNKNIYSREWFKEIEDAKKFENQSDYKYGNDYFDFDNEFEDIDPI
jgi:hypothetical protein